MVLSVNRHDQVTLALIGRGHVTDFLTSGPKTREGKSRFTPHTFVHKRNSFLWCLNNKRIKKSTIRGGKKSDKKSARYKRNKPLRLRRTTVDAFPVRHVSMLYYSVRFDTDFQGTFCTRARWHVCACVRLWCHDKGVHCYYTLPKGFIQTGDTSVTHTNQITEGKGGETEGDVQAAVTAGRRTMGRDLDELISILYPDLCVSNVAFRVQRKHSGTMKRNNK